MRGTSGGGVGRWVSVLLLAGLLVLGFLTLFLPSGKLNVDRSATSVERDGRRALYLLLGELGFRPSLWTKAPGNLARGRGAATLILPAAPEMPPGYDYAVDGADSEEFDDEGERVVRVPPRRLEGSRRQRDPRHYLRFLEEGGTLVTGFDEDRAEFLRDTLGLAEFGSEALILVEGGEEEREVSFTLGQPVSVDWDEAVSFGELSFDSEFELLAADAEGQGVALRLPVGRGSVVLLPDDEFLRNGALDRADNAVFFVRLLEELGLRGDVLFDEYSLGGWVPESPLHLAFSPTNFVFTLHLLGLVGLIFWSAAWVRQFARDPEPLGQLSALSRARAHAGLLVASKRWDLCAGLLRLGVLRRLARRSGAGSELLQALGDGDEGRRVSGAEGARAVLAPLAGVLGGEKAVEHAVQLFERGGVKNQADLERLEADLRQLEERAIARGRREQ